MNFKVFEKLIWVFGIGFGFVVLGVGGLRILWFLLFGSFFFFFGFWNLIFDLGGVGGFV